LRNYKTDRVPIGMLIARSSAQIARSEAALKAALANCQFY